MSLNLAGNNISRIEFGTLEQVERLSKLDMTGNPSVCSNSVASPWSFWQDTSCSCAPGLGGQVFCVGESSVPKVRCDLNFDAELENVPCPPGTIQTNNSPRTCLQCPPGTFTTYNTVGNNCSEFMCPAGTVDSDLDSSTPCVVCDPNLFVPAGSANRLGCSAPEYECPLATLDHDQNSATACVEVCSSCTCEITLDARLADFDAGFGLGLVPSIDCSALSLSRLPAGLDQITISGEPIAALKLADSDLTTLSLDRLKNLTSLALLDVSKNNIAEWPADLVSFFAPNSNYVPGRDRAVLLDSSFNPSECTVSSLDQDPVCLCDARFTGDGAFCERTFAPTALSTCPASYTDHDSNNQTVNLTNLLDSKLALGLSILRVRQLCATRIIWTLFSLPV